MTALHRKFPFYDCNDLLKEIYELTDELAQRVNDFKGSSGEYRAHSLKMEGKHSIKGHLEQFVQKQRRLRELLLEFEMRSCGSGPGGLKIPSSAWTFATYDKPALPATPTKPSLEELCKHAGLSLRDAGILAAVVGMSTVVILELFSAPAFLVLAPFFLAIAKQG